MQDLSKMSVEELLTNTVNFQAVVAELTRRMTPPDGHVRLPDGRNVEIPQDLLVLFRIQADTEEAAEAARAKEAK